ncbi:restriction endonuclease subunit S [Aliarcobacter butzleri]|uniref:Type I restriction modification DNA specificity domain-containing protein n=1 Tax=bioreactor metagenome TaxID=1076179 RepID=A0A644UWE7_9ZZZZ|nr:restriction endonuclease subunit S [Aliarcobacter butzleri]MCG3677503.1 restriction endonuclease subunit S [Aliarcobacter butzleri]MDK2091595.1 restriction endonuclease subunit S [Aliarcobacter butzleri]
MTTKSKVPQIRFKGFSGEWEESKLNEKAFITMGQSPVSSSYNENSIGLPLIQGNADCKERKTSPRIFASQFTKECFINDIVMTVRAPVGYVSKSLHHACIGRGVCSIKSKEDGEFLFQFLINYENQWLKFSQGSTFTAVNSDDIKNLNLIIPNHNEQTKIGDYFQQLDKLIEQKEKKYQKLKQFKKAMLDKMFPKNGADTPEIRFKGFSSKWEEKSLSELIEYKNGKGHEDKQTLSGKYELINLNSISIDGGLKHSGKFVNETESTLNENDLVMVLSDVGHGDLLGRVALIPENNKFVLNQRVALLRPFNNIIPQFLFYNINVNQKYFKMQGAGMSQLNISKSSVESFISYIPSDLKEQQKIGNYFQKLDKQIELQQKELEKLKNIKKASLSKMFV